jgi:2-succinyl-5-enolpyruvyl-6-hydroxy-3-cyclohexene-1-carboxylate synthase
LQKAINTLVSHVVNNGIRHVVICPGSRNAPLTLSFTRHPEITCYSLVDERSAAFTALGMAVALNQTVAIVCTSGTAVLNFYPAICEAYYSQIPLLVITADRPVEMIDNWDGQCIRQTEIFEKHILGSFTFNPLLPDFNFNEAIGLCRWPKKGPVHINVPLAEPLYEVKNEEFNYENLTLEYSDDRTKEEDKNKRLSVGVLTKRNLENYKKIILFAGADAYGARLKENFDTLKLEGKVVVLADIISGLHDAQSITNWDAICTLADLELKQHLKPDLLITIGKFTVSKGFKKFIRDNKPAEHWHVTPNHTIANPFDTNPEEIEVDESDFLRWLLTSSQNTDGNYFNEWKTASEQISFLMENLFLNATFNEFSVAKAIIEYLPKFSHLHLANSMPVRFISFLAEKANNIEIYGNRGTSGIDGSTSTAVGTSLLNNKPTFLLTGDLSFFYDINGLWNKYLKPNFKIIVLNNGGGGIFRLIDGPNDLPERESYFATQSTRNCELMAQEFGFRYFKAGDFYSVLTKFDEFCSENKRPAILEIFVKAESTVEFYNSFKNLVTSYLETNENQKFWKMK